MKVRSLGREDPLEEGMATHSNITQASQLVPVVKENLPANAGDKRDKGSIPGLERSLGGKHGNPLQ